MTIRTDADIRRLREQGALTTAEEALIENCRQGEPTKLGEEKLPAGPSDARTIRADLLRYLITGGCDACPTQDWGVDLRGGYVIGSLNLDFANAKGGTRLFACWFENPIEAMQTRFEFLTLNRSHLSRLNAQGARVTGGVFLREVTTEGKISLAEAKIGGQLSCLSARFVNTGGHALNAQGAQVMGDVSLREVVANGEVRLNGAKIGGHLACNNAQFVNAGKRALNAEGAQVTGVVSLQAVIADGEVSLIAAKIDGQLACESTRFFNAGGDALNAQNVQANFLIWRRVDKVSGAVHLTGAHVNDLVDDTASWEKVDELRLNGFRFESIHGPMSAHMRLDWLAKDAATAAEFRPQPYEQLAKVYRAMGHEADWRRVLIAKQTLQRADERKRLSGFWGNLKRPWKWTWDFLSWFIVGYGYEPFRVVAVLLVLWLIGWGMAYQAWHAGDFAPNSDVILSTAEWQVLAEDSGAANPAAAWSAETGAGRDWETFNSAAYAFDVVVPIVTIGQTEAWAPSTTRGSWGWHLWWARWVLTVAGWIVTAVGAAAITGIIRRD